MSNIKFVSHQSFPEDQYTKELVYLCLDDKFRVAYVRKQTKTGGMFWSVMSTAIMKDGNKAYYESFLQDSTFMEKDIKEFLEKRKWEAGASTTIKPCPTSTIMSDDVPF
jgi:hypothetical protein